MANRYDLLEVRARGELACFTRPENHVERVSYPVMTPTAARGLLEAIFWKPQFKWRVREIVVLKPPRYFSILRNEVRNKASYRAARAAVRGRRAPLIVENDRTQRHTLALRDVDYIVRADIDLQPGVDDHPAKFRDQFRRRVRDGRCFAMPYLGCREFSAEFSEPDGTERPVGWSEDLGLMLLDIDYRDGASGRGTPRFFNARIENGVLRVPPLTDGEA